MAARRQRQLLAAGRKAPEFRLEMLGGGWRKLDEILLAGPAVLAFFKTTCPVCQLTFPFLERLHESPTRGAVQIFGISHEEADTSEFAAEFGVHFPILLDRGDEYLVSSAYEISQVPSLFVLEQDGTVAAAWDAFSRVDMEDLGRRLNMEIFRRDDHVPAWKAGCGSRN